MKAGWFVLGLVAGFGLGAAVAVVGLEWAVRGHYDRATKAEVKAMDCAHNLAVERSWGSLDPKRRKR